MAPEVCVAGVGLLLGAFAQGCDRRVEGRGGVGGERDRGMEGGREGGRERCQPRPSRCRGCDSRTWVCLCLCDGLSLSLLCLFLYQSLVVKGGQQEDKITKKPKT